ncbi:MAG TPA: protein-L-isoaspartate O-methyltransferase [Gammaproteobacteria bacterium]|jgi:protein-L-isoaspartate(D-aspartate) O-methyltransferase|nr:protein-L-isoaspartate O-methyltransferase [Gammaproteobacteria bacterium]
MDMQAARSQMVQQQIRTWEVLDLRILSVFETLPRDKFVPEAYRNAAYGDMQIPLPHGEVMLTPKVEGRLLQALNPQAGERALEIGTGSGYFAACLARLARDVLTVDIHPDFVETAAKTLKGLGLKNVQAETRDGSRLEWLNGRYDLIAVTGSLPAYEPAYEQQLNVGGRLCVVVGKSPVMEALLVTRTAEDAWTRDSLFETDLPALKNAVAPRVFRF